MAYSQDLRSRVVEYVEVGHTPQGNRISFYHSKLISKGRLHPSQHSAV